MRYVLAWRLLVISIVALLVLVVGCLLLQEHPVPLFGSVSLSRYIIGHWFFFTLIWLQVASLIAVILIFFAPNHRPLSRLVLAFCALFIPFFCTVYWLVGVELPWRRAHRPVTL